MPEHLVLRNAEILARFEAGESLQDISVSFGISGERVRQIAKLNGVTPKSERTRTKNEQIVEFAKSAKTQEEVIAAFDIRRGRLIALLNAAGIPTLPRDAHIERDKRLDEIIAGWRGSGQSIFKFVGGDKALERAVTYRLRKTGIEFEKRHRATTDDLNSRVEIIRQIAAQGGDKTALFGAIKKREQGAKSTQNLALFFLRHCPDAWAQILANSKANRKREPKPAPVKRPRLVFKPKPQADVQVMADIRETAIANYGKAPASRIALATGTTRNSIIGHWFRARQQGLIA